MRMPREVLAGVVAAAVGAWMVYAWGRSDLPVVPAILALALAGAAAVLLPASAALRRPVVRGLERLELLDGRRAIWGAVAFAVLAVAYILFSDLYSRRGRTLQPVWHDEFMYLLQARLITHGRLWMPPHPMAEFFDTFYVLMEPVYAPLSWPGTALLLAPAVAVGAPKWVVPLACGAACVGLTFWLLWRVVDGVAAVLGALMLVGLFVFRQQALTAQAQMPTLLMGLVMIVAWLRWRDTGRLWHVAVLGAAAGWAAIMRPVDAICFALPIGIAMLPGLWRLPARRAAAALGLIVAAAAPFLALQVVFNVGVTGDPLQPPFTYYNEIDQPQVAFGLPRYDPAARPRSTVPQKQLLYTQWIAPYVRNHQPGNFLREWWHVRVPITFTQLVPHPLLLVLVPVGVLGLRGAQRLVMVAVLPLFLAAYALYTIYMGHYSLVCAPAMALLVGLGMRWLRERSPPASRPAGAAARVGVPLAVAALCVLSLPEIQPGPPGRTTASITAGATNPPSAVERSLDLPRHIRMPALVLFRFHPSNFLHDEPVYNIDTAWPDDATIIRAHDRGAEENRRLIEYYAARDPGRHVYLFDRRDHAITYLGTAAEIFARGGATTLPATSSSITATATTSTTSPPPAR